ncbi:DNA-binding transcriptional regulator, MarR family [Marinospirillum celere]|uniref:DNA-binding transcriptional regulator, MarR family n=1 Tax=Marinospirillum celere TaxID=1122252 RepID=A0A1I1FPD4_9GAMM|nr:MarR family transcriptional regulator [Marinospirillum celere]SFC01174.1 DNA-binding transcriptional regulator, MarR family [Marinospirillum celere]
MSEHKTSDTAEQLQLKDFFPYRLSSLQAAVSAAVAQLYQGRFELTHHEWRLLATLHEYPELSAKQLAEHTNLEKMQVSRAVARMTTRELLEQTPAEHDRRYLKLSLTEAGHQLYQQIVPLVLEREAWLLADLNDEERRFLDQIMDRLLARTRQLQAKD